MSKRKRERLIRRTIFLIILITTLVFLGVKAVAFLKPLLGFEEKSLKRLATIDFKGNTSRDKDMAVGGVGEYICTYAAGKINLYDNKGNLLWERDEIIKEPLIRGNDKAIIITDRLSGKISFIDYNGDTLFVVDAGGKVDDVKAYKNQYVAVLLAEENKVMILNENGEEHSNIVIPKGEILDFQLSSKGDIIAVALLNVEEYEYYSNILLYSLDGRVLAGNKLEESIMFSLYFNEKDQVLAFGDNKMLIITKEEGVTFKKSITETINKIDIMGSERVVLNSIKNKNTIIDTKNRNAIIQMNLDGEVLYQTPMVADVLGMDSSTNIVAAFSKRTIYLIDSKGSIIFEKKINMDIENIFWISQGSFAVVYKDKLEILTLNY